MELKLLGQKRRIFIWISLLYCLYKGVELPWAGEEKGVKKGSEKHSPLQAKCLYQPSLEAPGPYLLCYKLLCFFQTEQLITLWVLFVFTIVGNSVVLFSIWRRKRKSRMTFFVTQLAITGKWLYQPETRNLYPNSCRVGKSDSNFCKDTNAMLEPFSLMS